MTTRTGEYFQKGDYHKKLDRNWPFYPVYLAKMSLVDSLLQKYGKGKKVLDLGCGEGVFVDKKRKEGFDIIGADLNYESEFVSKRNILNTGFKNGEFDVVMCLDVIEHLSFEEQEKAIVEIKRILKRGGIALLSLPNLAHFASRLSFFFTGKLIRTSEIERHRGDRPIGEYLAMLKKNNFAIAQRKGLFPTFPLISFATYYFPGKTVLLHKIYNKLFAYPNWCFLNFIVCKNNQPER